MDFYADFKVKLYRQSDGYPQLKESQICQMPAAILATNDECRFDPQKISPITGETRPRGIKQMAKTTNPEITRRIRVFVSSLEGFISQGKPGVTFFFWEGTAHMRDGARKSSRQGIRASG